MMMAEQTKKRAAVVIPIRNECKGLDCLLTTLSRQLHEDDEVICIDTGSTDGSWEKLCRFAETHTQFKAFRKNGAYPGAARNAAIRRTTAQFIAQIDGGNLPREDWLPEILAPLLDGRADYVMGDVAVMPVMKSIRGEPVDMGKFYGASLFRGPYLRGRQLHPPAGGASVAYRRRIWEKAVGFPDWLRTGEDRLFAQKLMRQHPRIVFADKAVVKWELGPTLLDFLKRHRYHQEMRVRRGRAGIRELKGILLQFSVPGAFAAMLVYPFLWPLPLGLLGAAVLHQSLKSIRTYYVRPHGTALPKGRVAFIFIILEALVFPARLLGTISGLLRRNANPSHERVKEYLAQ